MSECCLCGWVLRPGERETHAGCAAKRDGRMRDGVCVKCGLQDAEMPSRCCAQCAPDGMSFRGYSEVY